MFKKLVIGLLILPCLSFAGSDLSFDEISSDGNVRLVNGVYTCTYGNMEEAKNNNEEFKGAGIYIEKIGSQSVLFTVSLPGDIAINPPIAKIISSTKNSITYQSKDGNGNLFTIGTSNDTGVVVAIVIKEKVFQTNTLIYKCNLVRDQEKPALADEL
ncbi:hypothetical protein PROVRETT_09147 [Providencia rettgeri DSM 1131]|uniref:hypothetical protein n=1 Tax=Providencia rettgeri TaxID=587 RepID=UPI000197C06B|nr:hypothetical protein [Providencia rettgeri]EFE51982.1 hypothetical protein PROVRETT_09147 [Providencia rettgeri DSM 1131]QXA57658.1 hypothetical protein I6L79_20255 [Providencia rettgeri]